VNILYLCDEYPPCQHGGIGTVTQALARAVTEKGHRAVVAGFYPYYRRATEHENDQNVEIYRFFYGSKWKLRFSKHPLTGRFINIKKVFDKYIDQLNRLIEEYKIDIIEMPDFSEATYYGQFTAIDFSKLKKPFVVKLHGTQSYFSKAINGQISNKTIYELEKRIFKIASGIIAISDISRQINQEIYQPIVPIVRIYNGIHINNNWKYKGNQSDIVVFAGTLEDKKGVFHLAAAWEIVNKIFPGAKLNMYGKGVDYFKKKLGKNIPDSLFLKGAVSHEQLIKIYTTAACTVFPSFAETLGMAPIEAMAVGCPVIFTMRTSGPEIINHGIDGLLVDPDNIQEIADAILWMLTNRKYAVEMGQQGYNKVRERFDIEIIADKHIKYYKGCLDAVKRAR